jgi:hypothetical protein
MLRRNKDQPEREDPIMQAKRLFERLTVAQDRIGHLELFINDMVYDCERMMLEAHPLYAPESVAEFRSRLRPHLERLKERLAMAKKEIEKG